ncbi:MAG: UDP-N-acetylmuramate--L-alanine ligase [Tetrasphaera sp.]
MTDLVRNPRFDFAAPLPRLETLGHTHFIAIGGSGMSGIAHLYAASGLPVDGCDQAPSQTLDALARAGVAVRVGHDVAHLDGVDTLVVSSAIPESNPELHLARAGGLRVLHRAQALAIAMGGHTRVAVAGANGKTTTTAMTVSALRHAGLDPSYAVGSVLLDTGAGWGVGSGSAFVVEADESDGSFLCYRPHIAVVTNVQPDHLDFYGDVAHVEAGYAAFAESIPSGGLLVASADDPGAARLAAHAAAAGRRVATVGEAPGARLRIEQVELNGLASRAVLRGFGETIELRLGVPGRHNVHNAAAAVAAGWLGLDADPGELAAGLAGFSGTRRRFQVAGRSRGVTVVDDYAHNPAKVAAVVAAARAVAGRGRVRLVFQPHLFSRTRDFAAAFAQALTGADQVVLLPVYGAREAPIPGVDSHLIAERMPAGPCAVTVVDTPDEAVTALAAAAAEGDLILTVGAGDVTRLGRDLLAALEEGDQ